VTPSAAATFATRLLDAFVELGVQHAVVSPGSRSQALALALAEFEARGALALHVRIDERVAAFTALGIARETGRPALVVTTSGTAVANLLPAVMEASHSGVPMLLLTADRPERLRGTGSNQTTWQPGVFGRFARGEVDVPAPTADAIPDARALADTAYRTATSAAAAGPVHLNLQFVEPLSGALIEEPEPLSGAFIDEAEAPSGAFVDETEALSGAASGSAPASGTTPGVADPVSSAGASASASLSSEPRSHSDSAAETAAASDSPSPTAASGSGDSEVSAPGAAAAASASPRRTLHLAPGPRTLVVAGADAGERANAFALHAGWPLIAEVSSGARFGPNLVPAYRRLLDHPDFAERIERVVVFGHPTLSRQVAALVGRDDLETVVVRGRGEPFVPSALAVVVDEVTADAEDRADRASRAWTGQWVFAGRELLDREAADDEVAAPLDVRGGADDPAGAREFARAELAALRAPVSRRALALATWQATWPHDRLVLGASRLIRERDVAAGGKKVTVHANRGLAGIDGTISTALGIAAASQTGTGAGSLAQQRAGTTRVLLGDLALLHDVGALLLTPGERRPRIQLVVGNDGGGTIFDGLEVASTAVREAFDRVMFTPQDVGIAALAAAYGWEHRAISTRGDLDSALASPPAGPSILEVALER